MAKTAKTRKAPAKASKKQSPAGDPDFALHSLQEAFEKAKSFETDKVVVAMGGQTFQAPSGFVATMDPKNHHLHKPVLIGEVKADGQFNVVWKTKGPVKAQPWSPFIPGNDKKKDEPEVAASKKVATSQ